MKVSVFGIGYVGTVLAGCLAEDGHEIVAVDIGGTHARFALARIDGRRVIGLTHELVIKAAEHASLQTAWEHFAATVARPLPRAAAIAIANGTASLPAIGADHAVGSRHYPTCKIDAAAGSAPRVSGTGRRPIFPVSGNGAVDGHSG